MENEEEEKVRKKMQKEEEEKVRKKMQKEEEQKEELAKSEWLGIRTVKGSNTAYVTYDLMKKNK